MSAKLTQEKTVSAMLACHWQQIGEKFLALAEAMPEDKFGYKPIDGTRTVGDLLRHVAFWNQYVRDSVLGKNPSDAANELPRERFSTKRRIIDVLHRSTVEVVEALGQRFSDLTPELVEMLGAFVEHTCEHYGQLVVYARLNGIVPPVSRG